MITRTIVVILGYLCVAGFVVDGQYCNATSNACPSGQQCTKNPTCNWGMCSPIICSTGQKLNASTCVTPMVNVGGNCSFPSDCKGIYTMCNTTNQCGCTWNTYTVKNDSSDCIPPPSTTPPTPPPPPPKTPLNGTCTSTNQNCGLGAACASSNTCQCLPANTPVGGTNNIDCRPLELNDPCSNATDCVPNALTNPAGCKNANCNNGTYQCNSGYWLVTSDTFLFKRGCLPTNVSANVASGRPCSYDPLNNNYQLCGAGLTCVWCPENPSGTGTCQQVSTPTTTTTTQKPGSASNVQVNIMALAAALAFFRFAA